MKIAFAAKDDTLRLSEAIALEYAKGGISERELKDMLGSDADDVTITFSLARTTIA